MFSISLFLIPANPPAFPLFFFLLLLLQLLLFTLCCLSMEASRRACKPLSESPLPPPGIGLGGEGWAAALRGLVQEEACRSQIRRTSDSTGRALGKQDRGEVAGPFPRLQGRQAGGWAPKRPAAGPPPGEDSASPSEGAAPLGPQKPCWPQGGRASIEAVLRRCAGSRLREPHSLSPGDISDVSSHFGPTSQTRQCHHPFLREGH